MSPNYIMNQMVKPKQFEIAFSLTPAVYHPGQMLRGQVILCLKNKLKMRSISVELVGRGRVHWRDNAGRSGRVVYFRSEEEYFHGKIRLFGSGSGEETVHPVGLYSYPFEMELPSELPSSFEGDFGFVRYSAKANIDIKMGRDFDTKSAFTVLSHLDLNAEPEDLKVPVQGMNKTAVNCCWLASGDLSAEFRLEKRGFVAGETIEIRGRIDNNSSTIVRKSRVELKQYVEYFGIPDTMFKSKEPKAYLVDNCLASVERNQMGPGETDIWNDVSLQIPPIPPSRLNGCKIINISYAIELNVWAKYGGKLTFSADIVIGTIPFYEYPRIITNQPRILGPSTDVTAESDHRNCETEADSTSPTDANLSISRQTIIADFPSLEFQESRQGRVSIREEGESRTTKGRLLWAPVYITYTASSLRKMAAATAAARKPEPDVANGPPDAMTPDSGNSVQNGMAKFAN